MYLETLKNSLVSKSYSGSWAMKNGLANSPKPIWVLPEPTRPLILPNHDELYLWVGTVKPSISLETLSTGVGLSKTETDRLHAFRQNDDKTSYTAAHGALRLILGNILKRLPGDIEFLVGSHGKPQLCPQKHTETADLHFNISHSGNIGAVAIASFPVGIDIEVIRWSADLMNIAHNNFAQEHFSDLKACEGDARTELFFRQWTLGEALIKATGLGFNQPTDHFAFTAKGPPKLIRLEPQWGRTAGWHFGLI